MDTDIESGVVASPVAASSPWHAGELTLQRAAGVAERMDMVGRHNIRDHLIEQHRQFFLRLPFVILGTVDTAGDAWATLRADHPGFLRALDARRLHVELGRDATDPADAGMHDGAAIALLGIQLETRRRNRLNGTIRRAVQATDSVDAAGAAHGNAPGFDVLVEQSYGNCPKYIFKRDTRFVRDPSVRAAIAPLVGDRLDDRARNLVMRADSFFVATYVDLEDGRRQVDVSHRGGKAGFVRVDAQGVLTIPDFMGNTFFNTLGNIVANPRAGLVFIDYASGDLLQLTGAAEVLLDTPEIAAFQGAERLWRFTPRGVVYRAEALPLRWTDCDDGASPYVLPTGDWAEAAERIKANMFASPWRSA